jgi:SP family myo-inositol transporter-like MFS transporter 13
VLADSYGGKGTIMLSDAVFVAGALRMSLANSIAVLIIGRFIAGIGIGISAMIVPVYIGESAPKENRGALIAMNGLFITGSQLVAYGICLGCGDNWRLILGLSGVPAAVQLIAMLFST